MFKKLIGAFMALFAFASVAKADIADGKFSANQIFDVQYYWSGSTLNASSFIAPYDMNFQHPTLNAGDYFQFFQSTTNPGTYGLGLYDSTGALKQVVHNTGTLQAIGPDALFYIGSGFFGTVITTSAGYSYGQNGSFTNMNTSVTSTATSSYTWASTTPLASGQTASAPVTPPVVTPNYVSVNPSVVNVFPTSNNSPVNETATKALDATSGTKYLNFDRANAGFTIKLPAGKVVSALSFTTANDFEPRDPTKFTLQGSNDGVNWTPIATDQAITLSSSRQTTSANVSITNTTPYVYYFITFTSIKAIDTYGSVAGCQAALGTLACDSVQIGDVNFLTDSNNTATSTDQAVAGARVQNPGAPAPVISNGTPIVTSSSTTGTTTTTTTATRGTTTTADVVTRGTTVTTTSFADHAAKGQRTIDVTRTTTTVRTTPIYTSRSWTTPITTTVVTRVPTITTTITTPQIVTTYSDGTTSTAPGTPVTTTTTTYVDTPVSTVSNEVINAQIISSDVQTSSASRTESVASNGMTNAVKFRNNTLVMGSPLDKSDGAYAQPYGMRQNAKGSMTYQGGTFGYQDTVENNTWGLNIDVSRGESKAKNGSSVESESFNGSAYILTKQDYFWYKGQVGVASSYYKNSVSIPTFALSAKNKANQMNVYMDNTIYSPVDFYGFRPFAGALVNNSTIRNVSTTGSMLLDTTPKKGSTTFGVPYAGLRYEFDKNVSIEYRATQSPDFKTVHGVRASVKKEIDKDVYLDFVLGSEKGSRGYTNTYGMIGLVWKF